MTGHTFTDAQRHALYRAELLIERDLQRSRMNQATAFCNGNDRVARKYDGPDGLLAPSVRDLAGIRELLEPANRDHIERLLAS